MPPERNGTLCLKGESCGLRQTLPSIIWNAIARDGESRKQRSFAFASSTLIDPLHSTYVKTYYLVTIHSYTLFEVLTWECSMYTMPSLGMDMYFKLRASLAIQDQLWLFSISLSDYFPY